MTPKQMSAKLRRFATSIDQSNSPDRNLVIKHLRRIIAEIQPQEAVMPNGGAVVVQNCMDSSYYIAMETNQIIPSKDVDIWTLPNGDDLIVAKSVQDLVNSTYYNAEVEQALREKGLI